MSAYVALLVVGLNALATSPALTADFGPDVDADIALWRKVPLLVESFEEPPADWHRIENPQFRFSIALPCDPEQKRTTEKGITYLTYQCVAKGHPYIVLVSNLGSRSANASNNEQSLSTIYLHHADAARRRAVEVHLEAEVLPEHRILYQGVVGRQSIFVAKNMGQEAVVTTRLLPGSSGVMISLQAANKSRKPTREMQLFFNSLKIL